MIGHLRSETSCSKSIRNIAAFHQMEVGTGQLFLNLPYNTFGLFTAKTWLTNLWEYISSINLTLSLEYEQLPLQRTNDKLIMDLACHTNEKNARAINNVRKFLNTISLADLTTARGDRIEPNLFTKQPEKSTRKSLLI